MFLIKQLNFALWRQKVKIKDLLCLLFSFIQMVKVSKHLASSLFHYDWSWNWQQCELILMGSALDFSILQINRQAFIFQHIVKFTRWFHELTQLKYFKAVQVSIQYLSRKNHHRLFICYHFHQQQSSSFSSFYQIVLKLSYPLINPKECHKYWSILLKKCSKLHIFLIFCWKSNETS